ncbi:dienelactone hydrolase family protein [Hyphobacterium sp. CCMP332]|nr:dienelactone hydrolase family protein [Hyphobacterium sp. CCMP332]
MNRTVILLFICLSASALFAQSPFHYATFRMDTSELNYRIMYPENMNKGARYPLVLFLHGSGERDNDNEKQLVHGSKLFIENRSSFPAVVIFPQCRKGQSWAKLERAETPQGLEFIYQYGTEPNSAMKMVIGLLDSILASEIIDKSRIYVGGLSMGGMGTFEILWRRPDIFAAAFPICGGGNPVFAEHYNKNLSAWVFHGANDDVVKPSEVLGLVESMKDNIKEIKFTLYPDANHNSWDPAFAEKDLLPWLFSKSLKQ